MKHVRTLVREFADSVQGQTDSIKIGNHKESNRYAKRYIAAFKRIAEIGDDGRDCLAGLLSHDRSDVRTMAAAFLLRYRHDDARAVLEAEAKGDGIVALEAQETLKRWAEGVWNLDPS